MLRFAICKRFAEFYRPCRFKLEKQKQEDNSCQMFNFISLYRKYGHLYAKLDPLGIYDKQYQQFIRPTDLGISFQDKISKFKFQNSPVILASRSIEELQNHLIRSYRSTVGVEFENVESIEEKQWLYQNMENLMLKDLSSERKLKIAKTIIEAEGLDHFLHKKFVTFKRYSGEGAESTVMALDQLFEAAAQNGFKDVVFGMPHRGRLNTLVNILQYPASLLFRKISGKADTPLELFNVLDDVVSHVAQSVRKNYNGKQTKVTMVHNPSHLEAQNPVSMGKARSKLIGHSQDDVLNIQVHGDAAICAQGIVYQSLLLNRVPKFDVNGTIHIITNNQIGYTTNPIDSRSTKYASDVAKAFMIPIIHVNVDNIEDVSRVMELCMQYRMKFKKDIMVDLICYRKYGHNEVDEPEFTQPKMYHQIRKVYQPKTKRYAEDLQKLGLASDLFNQVRKQQFSRLEEQFVQAQKKQDVTVSEYTDAKRQGPKAFTEQWTGFKPSLLGEEQPTGFDTSLLQQFAKASIYTPNDFSIHARIKKYHTDERLNSLSKNKLNWATCETLAFFSLNYEGFNIRMSGQDVQRGTFSQRHMNLVDQKNQSTFNALEFFSAQGPGRGNVQFYNSPLTQNAAMSFEYGFAIDNPRNFVAWEAQFGDFFNTAQVVIDTYITNSQTKWLRQNGLVLILPHGFDGAGPEHSSCRIQRFLQLANTDGGIIDYEWMPTDPNKPLSINQNKFYQDYKYSNFSFVIPTKPSNIFHVLRRQMKRNFRKPLIIAGPKTLLRHSSCISSFEDLGPNSKFEPILGYINSSSIQNAQTIVFCAGKYVYDIEGMIKAKNSTKTALFSIEELFPFPEKQVTQLLQKANPKANIYWVQEQNMNGGAYSFVLPRFTRILKNAKLQTNLKYVGRRGIAMTAVGSAEIHKKQTADLAGWVQSIIV